MHRPPYPPNDELVSFFHKHVVPIYFHLEKDGEIRCCIVSAFVMSIYNQWFLMTAGHCIEDIEKHKNAGFKLIRCRLIDCLGLGATHRLPIPLDYYECAPTKMCYDPNYDYGIIFLDEYYVRLLLENGVTPLNEEVWEKQPIEPDLYILMGVPSEMTKADPNIAYVTTTLHYVFEYPQRPDFFEETNAPTFFGRINLSDQLTTIVGLSGGPIFSLKESETGELKYWLHAMQHVGSNLNNQ